MTSNIHKSEFVRFLNWKDNNAIPVSKYGLSESPSRPVTSKNNQPTTHTHLSQPVETISKKAAMIYRFKNIGLTIRLETSVSLTFENE